jgi:hypothetical protein
MHYPTTYIPIGMLATINSALKPATANHLPNPEWHSALPRLHNNQYNKEKVTVKRINY